MFTEEIDKNAEGDSGNAPQYTVISIDHIDLAYEVEIVTVNEKADKRGNDIAAGLAGKSKDNDKEQPSEKHGGNKPARTDEHFISQRRPL